MQNNNEIKEQINAVSALTKLSPFVIEKDLYVTKAISIVSSITHDRYDLLFQGGTSLVKAYKIIERMSEDCDFRIRFKNTGPISNELKRKTLRQFRHELVEQLQENDFSIDKEDIKVRNEGQYMQIRAHYPSLYPVTEGIKPYISLDFFLGNVKREPVEKLVTTLIKNILGEKVVYDEFPVLCLDIIETASEKWVGLTRRVATSKHREYYKDPNLVRHLYDLYKIEKKGFFTDEFPHLVSEIILSDRLHFKNHNADYYKDPISEIKRAINELQKSTEWHHNWDVFCDAMIYEKNKPSYQLVMDNFIEKSEIALNCLKSVDFS